MHSLVAFGVFLSTMDSSMVNAVLPFNHAHFPVRGRMFRWNKQSYCVP